MADEKKTKKSQSKSKNKEKSKKGSRKTKKAPKGLKSPKRHTFYFVLNKEKI